MVQKTVGVKAVLFTYLNSVRNFLLISGIRRIPERS